MINSEGNSISVYSFARVLDELQIRLRNKKGEITISNEVKMRKFINTILDYMQREIKPKLTEREYIYKKIIKMAESEEAVNKDKGVNREKKKRQYNNPAKSWIKPQGSLPFQLKKLSLFSKGPKQHNKEAD